MGQVVCLLVFYSYASHEPPPRWGMQNYKEDTYILFRNEAKFKLLSTTLKVLELTITLFSKEIDVPVLSLLTKTSRLSFS